MKRELEIRQFAAKRLKLEQSWPATLDNFTVDFLPNHALAAKAFEKRPLVQIETTVKLPWVLLEPELN